VAWLETGTASPHQACPPRRSLLIEEDIVFIIGIDPHKGSHTAAVIDGDEHVVATQQLRADRRQRDRRLRFAEPFTLRVWAVEGATGVGLVLAQQLVAVGETVMDVPPALSARVRLLDAGRKDKNDAHDARSTAIVALRHRNLRTVALEDHRQVLRLLARRHHQLVAGRTRAICRVHALLAETIEGGATRHLSVNTAVSALRRFRPTDTIGLERKRLATELIDEVRRHDHALVELHRRTVTAVTAATTTVTDVFGVGPIVACYLIGYSGDVRRPPGTTRATTRPHPSKHHPARRFAIGSTQTGTGNSTMRSTSPR
jgi:transposase